MSAVIFAGPSIRGLDFPSRSDLLVLPPAKQGDLFRATLARPEAIGLIDGYFEGVPSVWHKEILWALSQGIRVFGGSSMGALRAAELDVFGMTGVGRIYEWYRAGVLEDDDEVALIHGPPESGFTPLSEPMVNVRATCEAAVLGGIITQRSAEAIVVAAKLLHFRERNWNGILAAASMRCSGLDGFARWLLTGGIDQKRLDAEALISAVIACIDKPMPPQVANFRFEWTNLWDRAVDEWAAGALLTGRPERVSPAAVLDELRLDPDRYAAHWAEALQRAVLLREADRRRLAPDRAAKLRQLARLRERLGLMRRSDLDRWLKESGLEEEQLETLMEDDARIEAVSRLPQNVIDRQILAVLRLHGEYETVARRAEAKQRVLDQSIFVPDDAAQDLSPPVLMGWFFSRRRQAVPNDLDKFVEKLGLSSRQALYRLLAAEYVYCRAKGEGSESSG
jgi:hypothetical protein